MKTTIIQLIREREELKGRLRGIDDQLTNEVMNFRGTLKDALVLGLVRLNFTAPNGYNRWLIEERKQASRGEEAN